MADDRTSAAEIDEYSLARDLSRLEINTILKSGMTGGRMPAIRYALVDIARAYARQLDRYDVALPQGLADPSRVTGGFETFDTLRRLASEEQARIRAAAGPPAEPEAPPGRDGQAARAADREEGRYHMLARIRSSCDDIKAMLKRHRIAQNVRKEEAEAKRSLWDNDLTAAEITEAATTDPRFPEMRRIEGPDLARLRKIWELKTEQIVMQTWVDVTGDVVIRIDPRYADAAWAQLHKLHGGSVDVSLRYWKTMIEIIAAFAGSLFKSLFSVLRK